MFKPAKRSHIALLAALVSGSAGAACQLQTPIWTVQPYRATQQATGTLRLTVVCEGADAQKQYTLNLSALGGQFDQASGAYVLGARGKANTVLTMQILGASPALGGTVVPTVYTGSFTGVFQVVIPAGQWQASGTPSINLNFDLSPFATGNSLP